jgi:hypothetical protein
MRFTPRKLAAGDTRLGPILPIHNVRVIHSRKGWTTAEAVKAVADAKAGIMYLREGIDSETLAPLPANAGPRAGIIFDKA